jgi:predicted PurR-regulated permease PerM
MSHPLHSEQEGRAAESTGRSYRGDILFTLALLLGLVVAYKLRTVLLLVYVSALFAVVLSPAIEILRRVRIGRWRPGRGPAILVIILAGGLLMALFFTFALPPVFHDLQAFAADLPRRTAAVFERLHHVPFAGRLEPSVLQEHAARAVGGALGLVRGLAGGLFAFFSWLVLTAYFILDGERAFRWSLSLFPAQQRTRLESTLLRAEGRMRHWLLGQGALMLILGCSSALAFGVMGIRYFYALAVIAGALNIVPILGPLVSFALAVLVAAVDSWAKVIGVVAFYFLYQQVENAFLTPRIMKLSVDLPPLAVIIALAVGGTLAGILGALIAVPTAALAAVLIDEYLVSRPDTPEEEPA